MLCGYGNGAFDVSGGSFNRIGTRLLLYEKNPIVVFNLPRSAEQETLEGENQIQQLMAPDFNEEDKIQMACRLLRWKRARSGR